MTLYLLSLLGVAVFAAILWRLRLPVFRVPTEGG